MKPPTERVPCPACGGGGVETDIYDEDDPCVLCDGAGEVTAEKAREWASEESETERALAAWMRGDKH